MVLDNLKDVWKNQQESTIVFSETDIYKMIHKKSASIVKWIFYISIIEFILLVVLPNVFIDNKEKIEELNLTSFVNISTVLSFVVAVVFMYLFYKNYKNICVSDSTKKLMNDILKTKKTVSYYIVIQLIMAVIMVIVTSYKTVASLEVTQDINMSSNIGFWLLIVLILSVFIVIIWLFYKLLYGILLNRLKLNYKELKKNE